MFEDIGADEYKIESSGRDYMLRIGCSNNNKMHLNISTRDSKQLKNYAGEFTLDDLRRINRVFLLTRSIYEAKEEFKKAVERKKIALSEKDDYIHSVFYLMIGTDTATLSIALPRDETPRIIRLEQNLNILKLGRDNLSDRLAVFEREADEIQKDLEKIQMGNHSLQQIADTIGQGIPDVSEILRNYKASKQNPTYTSSNQKPMGYGSQDGGADVQYSSVNFANNGDQQYTSANYQNTGLENINESLKEQNQDSSIQNNKDNDNSDNFNDDLGVNPSLGLNQEGTEGKFPNGILESIIKTPYEIEFVTNKIEEIFPNISYKLLYKGSRDGDTAAAFHNRCDDAEKTLVLVEDNYGNRFGGFTTQDWAGKYMQKKDDDAFIFSIDKATVYEVIPGQDAIGCYPNFGPVFFGCQIRIYDNFFEKGGTTFKKGLNYRTKEDFELTGGKQNFGVRELEVYEVNESQ